MNKSLKTGKVWIILCAVFICLIVCSPFACVKCFAGEILGDTDAVQEKQEVFYDSLEPVEVLELQQGQTLLTA